MRKTAIVLVAVNWLISLINVALGNWAEASFAFAAAVVLSNAL